VTGHLAIRLVAWAVAIALVALPIVGVLNGWFAGARWPVTQLGLRAQFDHVGAEQIRAAAEPALARGFFALRLDEVRDAVAQLPWVERVEARKRWPDRVDLVVYEPQPYARWTGGRLVNRNGALFRVPGDVGLPGLPRLAGPDERIDDVLRFHAECRREFSGSGLSVEAVTLSPRGGWRLEMGTGTVIEVGRDDAMPRLRRFLDVWPRIAPSSVQPPAYIDLRYENGFALRWAQPADPSPAPEPAADAPPQAASRASVPSRSLGQRLRGHVLAASGALRFSLPDHRIALP